MLRYAIVICWSDEDRAFVAGRTPDIAPSRRGLLSVPHCSPVMTSITVCRRGG